MNCKLTVLALASALAVSPLYAQAPESVSAETLPLVLSQSLMLDFVDSGNRAIAVGERGHIAVSESRGDWRQVADVPTRTTLTAVAAVGDRAWAVGHDGIILGSEDGGLTWAVQRIDTWSPPAADDFDAEFNPTQGAPLLDVLALDRDRVIAIGAYSLMLISADGGKSWQQVNPNASTTGVADEANAADEFAADGADADADAAEADDWTMSDESLVLEDEEDPHLNGIARTPEGGLLVVGERGSAYRSLDDGASWQRLRLPYDGSMFGVLALGERHVLAFGLRGNVQESRDLGDTWETPNSGTELSLQGGAVLPDGAGVLLVGSNGVLLKRAQGASEFTLQTFANERQETPVLSAALPLSATDVIVAGEKGVGRTSLK